MIYKDFVAEAAQKIMAAAIAYKTAESLNNDNRELGEYARGSVNAAKALADALDQDWQSMPVDGIHRFSEKEGTSTTTSTGCRTANPLNF